MIELDGGHITEYKGNYSDYKIQKEEFIKTQASVIANLESELEHQLEVKQTFLSHRNISGYHQREKVVEKLSDVLERERAKLPSGYVKMSFAATPRETEGRSDKILLEVKGVSKEFDGNVLFEDVSFELKADEKIFLCGPNGCGKTTMLSMLSGKASGASGTVLIAPSITCGFMGQFVPFDDESITCFDELISRSDLQTTEARSLLARFGFRGEDVFKTIDMLSGGERSRLYLCCLLNENPDILFLDEPTNHLDINSREILEDAIREYPRAVICVSHDRFFIDKCADKVMGFIGTSVKPYDKYEYYRKDINSVAAVVKQEPEKPVKKPRQVKSSKEAGQRRARLRDLEKEIASLEDQQKELEAAFGVNAKGDEYKKYGEIAEKLELLYDEYFALSEES